MPQTSRPITSRGPQENCIILSSTFFSNRARSRLTKVQRVSTAFKSRSKQLQNNYKRENFKQAEIQVQTLRSILHKYTESELVKYY